MAEVEMKAKIFYKTVTLKMSNWCFSKEEEI